MGELRCDQIKLKLTEIFFDKCLQNETILNNDSSQNDIIQLMKANVDENCWIYNSDSYTQIAGKLETHNNDELNGEYQIKKIDLDIDQDIRQQLSEFLIDAF